MSYKFTLNAPKPLADKEYVRLASQEFKRLLVEEQDDEPQFQNFFERNPHFVPGAKGEFDNAGPSGHDPYLNVLISQPKISGLATRHPDFMWLASDSQVFSPILIEIEAPSKKHFNLDETPTSHFTKAKNQLDEWKTVLSIPTNVLKFHDDYNLPSDFRTLIFEPYFTLIYGRRSECEKSPWLNQKRANLLSRNSRQFLMSFDRIQPNVVHKNFICSIVKKGEYFAKCLCPNFKLSVFDDDLLTLKDVTEAVEPMQFTSDERKEFLKVKLPILLEFLKSGDNSLEQVNKDGRTIQFEE